MTGRGIVTQDYFSPAIFIPAGEKFVYIDKNEGVRRYGSTR